MGECGAERFGPAIAGIGCCSDAPNEVTGPGSRRRQWARNKEEGMEMSGNNSKPNGHGNSRKGWNTDPRWEGITRPYGMEDVLLQRADQIDCAQGQNGTYWFAPIVADAEAGFGGPLNAFEIMKAMIEAGAAAVHFEDQLSSAKKCGHLGGKVVVPTREFIEKLVAARLAADVMGVPTLLIARTDANSAGLLLSDADPRDREFIKGPRTVEGFFEFRGGLQAAIARGLAYAPYVDMLWCETSQPDLDEARQFAEGIHAQFPGKMLAYNCSPSFNWKKKLSDAAIANFQKQLGQMGYKFQFVTLAGFHTLNLSMFELASAYRDRGMSAYSQVQQAEFRMEEEAGYCAVKHQKFVGTGYFDEVAQTISAGQSSTTALAGSTEAEQFTEPLVAALPEEAPQVT